MASSKLNSWADIATQGHYREQRRKIEQMLQSNAPEVEVTEKCDEPIVKPYTTGTEKSKSHGLMVTLGKFGKGKGPQPASDVQDITPSSDPPVLLKPLKLADYVDLDKSLDTLSEISASSTESTENYQDYDRAVEEMLHHVQESHTTNSKNLCAETQEVQLDLEKEFPALGNTGDSDGIVLGSRAFYQMKRSVETGKASEESNKKVLRLEDGSLFFGDEANISTHDLKRNEETDVVDDCDMETELSSLNRANSGICNSSEWEADSYVQLDHRPSDNNNKTTPLWLKEISDESTSGTTDTNKCDGKVVEGDHIDITSDIISQGTEPKEKTVKPDGPIWGIDSSLVDTPTCVFDVTVLPEQWLTRDLQGWNKMTSKPQSDSQQTKAQTPTDLTSNKKQLDADANNISLSEQVQDVAGDMKSYDKEAPHSLSEKHESGVESNSEVTSDNDHCDEASKPFGKKHCLTVGSTDDSNRSSPPSESNSSSDSESVSDRHSIPDINYDSEDATQGGTWGSRCPSPEPDDCALSFGLPSPTDIYASFALKNDSDAKLYYSDKTHKNAAQGKVELEPKAPEIVTLEKQSCDKVLEENKIETRAVSREQKVKEHVSGVSINAKDIPHNDKHSDDVTKTLSTTDQKNVEKEFSKVAPEESEMPRPRNTSPTLSRDQSLEGKEVRKILTVNKNSDSSSNPSRETSPCRHRQSRSQPSTIDIERELDISSNAEVAADTKPTRVVRKKAKTTSSKEENRSS